MPSIERVLELAQPSCYLAANYYHKGKAFGYGKPTGVNQSTLIYIVYTILNKVYENDPTRDGLQEVSDYLYELLQKFAFRAAQIVDGGGGGQITPITPTGELPFPYYFIVDGSSFIPDGDDTKTLPPTWQGYNMVFARGGITQTEVTTEPSYFTWDSETMEFFCSPAAVNGELFAMIPT